MLNKRKLCILLISAQINPIFKADPLHFHGQLNMSKNTLVHRLWLPKMASVLQKVTQKLKRGFRGISTCVIRGNIVDIPFPASMFEPIYEYAARCPMISKVPSGRLFSADPDQQIQIQDHWRRILFTALVHSVNCKANSDSICNAFDPSNIGVIRGHDIFAFRRFDRVYGMKNTNHEEFRKFVEDLVIRLYGPAALEQLDELRAFLSLFQDPVPSDYFLLHNPFFLGEMDIGYFYSDSHRLTRHELALHRQGHSADRILKDLGDVYGNLECTALCEKNILLAQLLGAHSAKPRARSIKTNNWPPHGSTVVDVHQIAATHCMEWATLDQAKARALASPSPVADLLNKYTRGEVIQGVRRLFPLYPHNVALSFEKNRVWYMLAMPRRLKVPDIFGYVPVPPNGPVPGLSNPHGYGMVPGLSNPHGYGMVPGLSYPHG